MKFTELPNVGITNTWRENIFSYLKETRSLSLNFIFLNKTFTVLNNRRKCIVYSGKMRLNYVLKLLRSAWSPLNVSSCTNCWYDFITRTVKVCCLSNFWWRSRRKRNERFYKNRNFWNNFAPLLLVYLTLLGTSQ